MRFILLIAALFVAFPTFATAQLFSGGGDGYGRHFGGGGGNSTLHLSAENNFPDSKALGFAYGTLNRSTSAYVVCYKNAKAAPDVDAKLFSCKVSTKNGAGEISQAGVVGGEVVGVDYQAKPKQVGGPIVEALEIGGKQFDLNKGRVFVVSKFGQEIKVKQYLLKKVAPADVEAFLKLILDIADNKTAPPKHAK